MNASHAPRATPRRGARRPIQVRASATSETGRPPRGCSPACACGRSSVNSSGTKMGSTTMLFMPEPLRRTLYPSPDDAQATHFESLLAMRTPLLGLDDPEY